MTLHAELAGLDKLSDDSLLELLGKHLQGRSALPPSPRTLIAEATTWLRGRRDALADKICASTRIQELASAPASARRLDLAAAIVDVLLGMVEGPPVAIISILLVREGIHNLCRTHWT